MLFKRKYYFVYITFESNTAIYIYKSKNINENITKKTVQYLVILKECKNMHHVFVDNIEEKFYNIDSYGREKYEEGN